MVSRSAIFDQWTARTLPVLSLSIREVAKRGSKRALGLKESTHITNAPEPSYTMASLLVCSASKVLLPGRDEPTAATIIVDKVSGKIIEVRETLLSRDGGDFIGQSVEWINAGDNIVLPGLVE